MIARDPSATAGFNPLYFAAARFVAAPDALSSADYTELRDALRRYLASRFPTLTPDDVDDVSAETVERVLAAARRGRVDPKGNPAGYLLRAAHNAAVQRLRRSRETPTPNWQVPDAVGDDEVASALLRRADATAVRRALAAAYRAEDTTVVRVVTYLLDELEETGVLPSNRRAGADLGLSHTGVAKARERFRAFVERLG